MLRTSRRSSEGTPRDRAAHPHDATERVIWKDRHCPRWSKYEPGVAPREQLQEAKERAFEEERRAFTRKLAEFESRQVKRERHADRRLTKAAIWLASIILKDAEPILVEAGILERAPGGT